MFEKVDFPKKILLVRGYPYKNEKRWKKGENLFCLSCIFNEKTSFLDQKYEVSVF